MRSSRITAIAAVGAAIGAVARPVRAEPSDETLVLVGAGMALLNYVIGVSLHEGSHALAAKLVGADVDELHLFPPGIDPHVHVFRFGWTYVHGLRSRRAHELFYLVPKLTDVALARASPRSSSTRAWPANKYRSLRAHGGRRPGYGSTSRRTSSCSRTTTTS